MRQKLVAHLTDGLHAVERELQRRGLESRPSQAREHANDRADRPASHHGKAASVNVQAEGAYELYEAVQKHRILVLEHRWYAWVEGHRGAVLVPIDDSPRRAHTLQRGRFVLADAGGTPGTRLFLERADGRFEEYVVPKGLPVGHNGPHRIVETGRLVAHSELENAREDGLSAWVEAGASNQPSTM